MEGEYAAGMTELKGLEDIEFFLHIFHKWPVAHTSRVLKYFLLNTTHFATVLKENDVDLDYAKYKDGSYACCTAPSIRSVLEWLSTLPELKGVDQHVISVHGLDFICYGGDEGAARMLFNLLALVLRKDHSEELLDEIRSNDQTVSRVLFGMELSNCLVNAVPGSFFHKLRSLEPHLALNLPDRRMSMAAAVCILKQFITLEDIAAADPTDVSQEATALIDAALDVYCYPNLRTAAVENLRDGHYADKHEVLFTADELSNIQTMGSAINEQRADLGSDAFDVSLNNAKAVLELEKRDMVTKNAIWATKVKEAAKLEIRDHSIQMVEVYHSEMKKVFNVQPEVFMVAYKDSPLQLQLGKVPGSTINIMRQKAEKPFDSVRINDFSFLVHSDTGAFKSRLLQTSGSSILMVDMSVPDDPVYGEKSPFEMGTHVKMKNIVNTLIPSDHKGVFDFTQSPAIVWLRFQYISDSADGIAEGSMAKFFIKLAQIYRIHYYPATDICSTLITVVLVRRESIEMSDTYYLKNPWALVKMMDNYYVHLSIKLLRMVCNHKLPLTFLGAVAYWVSGSHVATAAHMSVDFSKVRINLFDRTQLYPEDLVMQVNLDKRNYAGLYSVSRSGKKSSGVKFAGQNLSKLAVSSWRAAGNMRGVMNLQEFSPKDYEDDPGGSHYDLAEGI